MVGPAPTESAIQQSIYDRAEQRLSEFPPNGNREIEAMGERPRQSFCTCSGPTAWFGSAETLADASRPVVSYVDLLVEA